MLMVEGHLTVAYEPYIYLLDELAPKTVYLMGGDWAIYEYPRCAGVLKSRNIPVYYPEGGRGFGDKFHYIKE
jgi:hypothetical protein